MKALVKVTFKALLIWAKSQSKSHAHIAELRVLNEPAATFYQNIYIQSHFHKQSG